MRNTRCKCRETHYWFTLLFFNWNCDRDVGSSVKTDMNKCGSDENSQVFTRVTSLDTLNVLKILCRLNTSHVPTK